MKILYYKLITFSRKFYVTINDLPNLKYNINHLKDMKSLLHYIFIIIIEIRSILLNDM
jgi:hypothetical protein